MIISILVAMDERGGIGLGNRLPWHLSADLKRFKELTMGHSIVMGRRTYQSIGRNLPGRVMLVLTHDPGSMPSNVLTAASLPAALDMIKNLGEDEVFIIGGSQVFAQALPLADRIYLTRVHAQVEADVYFPVLDESAWRQSSLASYPPDEKNDHPFSFLTLEKMKDDEPKITDSENI